MKVSIIIPTYKRCDNLKKLLQTLLKQNYDDFEVIVIDQSPLLPKNLEDILAAKDKIKYFNLPGNNAAYARNIGIKKAAGEIVICCDDDIMVKPDFIMAHAKNYQEPGVGAVSGRVSCSNDTPVSKITKVGRIRKYDGKIIANFNAGFKTDVEHAYGCNFSFRKELSKKIGGYDERLTGTGSFDDADLSFNIRKLGYRIVFDPFAEAVHLLSSGGYRDLSLAEKMYWYYHNFMIFYLKNLKKIFFPVFLLRQIGSILRCAVIFRDLRVIHLGLKGLYRGFIDYFQKPEALGNAGTTK